MPLLFPAKMYILLYEKRYIYLCQKLYKQSYLLHRDTVFIRQHDVEYRYKLIRDTVERIKTEVIRDSIPYEVRVVDIKEVPRQRTWFDKLCYCSFGILLLLLGFKLFKSSPRLF